MVGSNYFIKLGQQFTIKSVTDPATNEDISLDKAIGKGIFDINSAVYKNPATGVELTMVDAIDAGLVKITNANFHVAYKLSVRAHELDELNNSLRLTSESFKPKNSKIVTLSIRYVVDPHTLEIIPVNEAHAKNYIDFGDNTLVVRRDDESEQKISLKEAYFSRLAFTCDDLNDPEKNRSKNGAIYNVALVRKSTNGKEMGLKSALLKSWISTDKHVYMDKKTAKEISYSQAVDLGLLILEINLENYNSTKQ